jgi:hypothetical protein
MLTFRTLDSALETVQPQLEQMSHGLHHVRLVND